MYYNDEWGTVCDNGWDLDDAQVVSRQLGYGPPIAARGKAYYGQRSVRIWLDNLVMNQLLESVHMLNVCHLSWISQILTQYYKHMQIIHT